MRYFAVAVPAAPLSAMRGTGDGQRGGHEVSMTTDAVLLNNTLPRPVHLDDLRLELEGEHECMTRPVIGLEGILAHQILRYMAVIAGGKAPMAAALPRRILRGHDVTIDTGRRIIRQITCRP